MSVAVTKNLRDGTITIQDGDTPANSVAIACDTGDLKFRLGQRPSVVVQDRGEHSHLRAGDAQVYDGSFSVKFKEFLSQDANPVTPYEALLFKGAADEWVSTNDDGGDVNAIDLVFDIATPTSTEDPERITIAKCFDIVVDFQEGDPNMLNVSFKYYDENLTITKNPAT